MNIEQVLASVNDEEVIRFTQGFVQIDSVNGREIDAANYIAAACEASGMEVRTDLLLPDRPNKLCLLRGESEELAVILNGHTDTVPFFSMEQPLSGEIRDGYLWGRGSVDMKGGLAAGAMACILLARAGYRPRKGILLAAVIDEESEHRGSWKLAQSGLQADYGIVLEPSDLTLQVAHKGTAPMLVTFEGVLAHGSNPWVGVNAVEKAAAFVLALKELELPSVELPGVGTMQASYNVGLIEGGTQYNNVAHECRVWLDRRMVPGENQTLILQEVNALLARLAAADPQFKARVEVARPDWKWEIIRARGLNPSMTPPGHPLAQTLAEAHQAVTGQPVEVTYTHGYNDGDFMVNDMGIPTVNYGPGEGRRSHTAEEKLRLDHLLTATRVLIRALVALSS